MTLKHDVQQHYDIWKSYTLLSNLEYRTRQEIAHRDDFVQLLMNESFIIRSRPFKGAMVVRSSNLWKYVHRP